MRTATSTRAIDGDPERGRDVDPEDFVRLQFRYVALEAHLTELNGQLDEQQTLRRSVEALEAQAQRLSDELRAARNERERLVAALSRAADLNRRSLAEIVALGAETSGASGEA